MPENATKSVPSPKKSGAEILNTLQYSEAAQRGLLAPLFEPMDLRGLRLPNRFAMAPMTRSFSPRGIPGPDVARYYRKRAEGGVSLIFTEGVAVPHDAAIGFSGVDVLDIPSMYGEDALAGWKTVVDEVHAAGGLIAPQLWHQGGMRIPGTGDFPDAPSVRPSGIWGPKTGARLVSPDYIAQVEADTHPMSDEEISDVIAAYARAAASAKAIGFDAIAIHGAHGYLIDSFFWTETNKRTDRWGGDIAKRSRFGAEVVRAIREAIGPDMPIIFRFSQWKLQDNEARLVKSADELATMLTPLVEAGVDMFDISERNFDKPAFEGSDLSLAGWTKRVSGRRSMSVGSVGLSRSLFETRSAADQPFLDNLGRLADRFAAGEIDMVGVGRMLIAQWDWVRRIEAGEGFRPYHASLLKSLD